MKCLVPGSRNHESAFTDPTLPRKLLVTADQEGMADDCLVDFEEVPDSSYDPRQHIPSLPLRDEDVTSGANFSLLQDTGGNTSEQDRVVPDLIVAVYVVQFDTRRGKTFQISRLYDTCSKSL